ncbi:sensor histidine kinase [Photobacterium sp. CCB-ST2H9]|uniref:ATP-binding protein n=1 Tax=unclassified Photobacterium TaxID=2628852 RepID=UPI0020042400|nr:sensor histidine kinase [Photobacterium sp. CCB-ST2H9]UTM59275.1 sensor histidine kinase [Photobacterium sp. CCB-ST2H9]
MTKLLSLRHFRLKTRMVLILGFIAILQTGALGQFTIRYLDSVLHEQIGQQAMRVAQTIAASPDVIRAVSEKNTVFLQPLSIRMAQAAQARFVVIGDEKGIRLAHLNPQRLGKSMSDDDTDDNSQALIHGKSYIALDQGSIGWSIRGKAPIFSADGSQIIGIVSVGYLLTEVDRIVSRHQLSMIVAITLAFLFSVLMALWFANHFRKAIFNLEPEQIGRMFQERNATLETVREGIVAINQHGIITTFNHAAIKTLQLPEDEVYIGRHITDVLPDNGMLDVLKSGEHHFDKEIWLHDHNLIANRFPLIQNGEVTGVVSSFRLKNEVDLVSRKLTRIQQYAESLRSQSHEYNNKLHTIAGLIQIGAVGQALTLIGQETSSHQSFIQTIMRATSDSILAGCLLGKYNRARELNLELQIDENSQMSDIPPALPREQLVSILGNLIDNALEATLHHQGAGGIVILSMSDLGKELIFEVDDQGPGVPAGDEDKIFTRGYTTKNQEGHGIGLHLVKQLTEHLGGLITVEPAEPSGSRFTVYIPKSLRRSDGAEHGSEEHQ